MSRLKLTFGCWNYDRTRALMDGSVVPDGIDLNYLDMPVEETFFRMLRHKEFDVAELSLSSYSVSVSKPERPFVAIPVFPSRFFRHSCIYVNADSGIRTAKDLIGKRVGNPEYQMTAPVWIRGILSDHYGVPVDSVTYFTGGEEEPGRSEKVALDLPPNIKVQPIGPTQTLSQMLRDGEIDAMYTSLFRELLTYMMEDPRNIGLSTHLLFGAKNLERVGDHTTNIAETVFYLVRGEAISDDRPKGEDTTMARLAEHG